MDLSAIYSKTPKGLRARASLIGGLSSHLMKVLTHVDGANRAENILERFEKLSEKQLIADLNKLEQEGYIRLATVNADEGWALTANFEPMEVEEYQSEDELEAVVQAKSELLAKQLAQNKAAEQAKAEEKRLAEAEKAEKKAQKLKDKEKIKAQAKVQAQMQLERQQQENEEKKRLIQAAAVAEAAELAKQKAEAAAKQKAQQEAEKLAQEQAAERSAKLAEEMRHKAELKAREAAEQAAAAAEASAKEQARQEIERISRESEETQKKQEALRLAQSEAAEKVRQEKIEQEKLALEKQAQEKLAEEKQKNEAIEREKQRKEQARLEIANVLRKAEEDRKQTALQEKAQKLEEKRKLKAEQEARWEAERKAKEDAKELARQQKAELKAKAEAELAEKEKAKLAAEQARQDAENIAKAAEKASAEAAEKVIVEQQIYQAEQAERLKIEQLAVDLALAKQAKEEQVVLADKENTRLEMARIAKEAELARKSTDAKLKALEIETQLNSLNDFDAAEAAEEAAFSAEEEMAEAEKKTKSSKDKTSKKAAEIAGMADIRNAAIDQAYTKASKQSQSTPFPTKKINQSLRWLSKLTFIYLPLLLLVLVGLAHFVNLSTLIQPIEKMASENIGKAVSINKVHASLWPQPHLVLEQVTIGDSQPIKAVHVLPVATSLFDETKLVKSLVIDGLNLNQTNFSESIDWAGNLSHAKNIKVAQINLKNLMLAVNDLQLESFDGKVSLTDAGALDSIALVSSNNALSLTFSPQGADYAIDLKAANWQLPFNQKLTFSSLNAKGLASGNQIKFNQIDGEIYGGNLTGQINVQWPEENGQWKTAGDFKLENANAEQLLGNFDSAVIVDGKLALNGNFASQASTANKLAEASALRANFDVRQGDIQGIELSRAVMSRGQSLAGNSTSFDKLTGTVQVNKGQYQFAKLQLNSSQLNANGYINIAASQAVSGKVAVDLAAQSRSLQAKFAVSGRGKDLKSN